MDAACPQWRKSSWSSTGETCVEVADNVPGAVLVRDTKADGRGPVLAFAPEEWSGFLAGLKAGEFAPS